MLDFDREMTTTRPLNLVFGSEPTQHTNFRITHLE